MDNRYITCDNCGNKIPLGSRVYKQNRFSGLFCSSECFCSAYAETKWLTEEVAHNSYKPIKSA